MNEETIHFLDYDKRFEITVRSHFDEHVVQIYHNETDATVTFIYGNKQIKELADFFYNIIERKNE